MLLACKVVDERETLIAQIEETGAEMKRAGLAEAWLASADEGAAQVRLAKAICLPAFVCLFIFES